MANTKYISIDIMDVYDDQYICTLQYPRPALYPLCNIEMDKLLDFIFLKRPNLKTKNFSLHIG
jgi:hypothetical protein